MFLFSACKNCEDTSEPLATIYFEGKSYERAVGISAGKTVPLSNIDDLPLSIASDTTTYILFNGESSDTLAIKYNRIFEFESYECGFTVKLDSFKLLESSSFENVKFEIIDSTFSLFFGTSYRNSYNIYVYN